jgi:hypothetical protein
MAKKSQKLNILLGIAILILGILACGSIQVGVVTPTPEREVTPTSRDQASVSDSVVMEVNESQINIENTPKLDPETISPPTPTATTGETVTAWLGHIASMDQSSGYDDILVLSPKGTGELGLAGATPEIEAEIRVLRDAEGPNEWVHLWGDLVCDVEDINNCQILVNKLQYGTNYSEEEVKGWVGMIKRYQFNSADSSVFELDGDFPMWYSIHASQDQALQAQIEQVRDTGSVVKVDGQLLVGIPDVNGTRIEVSNIEVLHLGTQLTPEYEADFEISADWPVFVNDRYGYQIQYPMDATISLFGPVSFSQEDLPEGISSEQYMDSLLKEYTDRLCVQIHYSLGWITISAPPNQEKFLNPCGPTGVGAGEFVSTIQSVYVGDELYQANGHEIRLHLSDGSGGILTGETLDMHYEMYRIKLEDGTVIRYGSRPNHDATYEDYMMKTKETLLQILSTYQTTP